MEIKAEAARRIISLAKSKGFYRGKINVCINRRALGDARSRDQLSSVAMYVSTRRLDTIPPRNSFVRKIDPAIFNRVSLDTSGAGISFRPIQRGYSMEHEEISGYIAITEQG